MIEVPPYVSAWVIEALDDRAQADMHDGQRLVVLMAGLSPIIFSEEKAGTYEFKEPVRVPTVILAVPRDTALRMVYEGHRLTDDDMATLLAGIEAVH